MMLSVLLILLGIVFENHNSRVYAWDTSEFSVRLNNSRYSNLNEGRLEIYYSGIWGTVCDNGFTRANARVACASLGFAYIGSVIGNRRGDEADPIWLENVNCNGTETGLEQCVHDGWGVHNCSHDEDVAISCSCGIRDFTEPTGKISSPNFPMAYARNLDCHNYIRVTPGHTVTIKFLAFTIVPSYDWLMITCKSGNTFSSKAYSGFEFPAVLEIASCSLLDVRFYSYYYDYGHNTASAYGGFFLSYNITSDNATGGITVKPSNAIINIEEADKAIIFNCTSETNYPPWWMFSEKNSRNNTITNSTCGVINSTSYSHWFRTESLGPGSCNLIVVASTVYPYFPTGNLICTDSTLASETAIIEPKDCGIRNFTRPTGRISSPRYPSLSSGNYLNCNNYIKVPSGQSVVIEFMAFITRLHSDWMTITCESGSALGLPRYSGFEFPAVLTISSCTLLNVYFYSYVYYSSFSLTYNITSDNVKGGITTKPSNAFPRADMDDLIDDLIVFNCTTAAKYHPWWTFSSSTAGSSTVTVTNSKCKVNTSAPYNIYRSWFRTESLGQGSCNLIVVASSNYPYLLAGNLVCTDSTMSSATANISAVDYGIRNFAEPTGNISSPKFPLQYPDNLDCHNHITVPTGQAIIITFLDLNMPYDGSDWLTIICESGNVFRSPRFIGSQNNIPAVLTISSCSLVNVYFHTDGTGSGHTGFRLAYNITSDETYQNLKLRVSVLGSLFGIALVAIFVIVAILLLPKFRQLQIFLAAFVGRKTDGNEHELQHTEGESNLYANDIGNFVKVDESEYGQLNSSRTTAEPAIYQELRPKPNVKPKNKK